MGHRVGLTVVDAQQQLDAGIDKHEHSGPDGHRREYKIQTHIREHIAESQQYAEHRAGGTHRGRVIQPVEIPHKRFVRIHPDAPQLRETHHRMAQQLGHLARIGEHRRIVMYHQREHPLLHQCGSEAARDVVEQEARTAQHPLHRHAEHIEREHVEKQMHKAPVHEHVGDQLRRHELVGREIVECAIAFYRPSERRHQRHGQPHHHIYGNEVLGDGRHHLYIV